MNLNENKISTDAEINASLRVSLLALFGGAAVWLVVGLALGVVASLTFHKPDMFANCSGCGREPLASRRVHRPRGNSRRRNQRAHLAGIFPRRLGFAVRRLSAD